MCVDETAAQPSGNPQDHNSNGRQKDSEHLAIDRSVVSDTEVEQKERDDEKVEDHMRGCDLFYAAVAKRKIIDETGNRREQRANNTAHHCVKRNTLPKDIVGAS